MQVQLFDARMLAPLVRYVDLKGGRSETFLDRARIPGELIAEGGWIAKKQAYDLTHDIVESLRCPDIIFSAYLQFQLEHLGPIADAMRACQCVKESLEVGAQLGGKAYEGNEYFLEIDGDTTWFCYRERKVISEGQPYIDDMTLAVYYQLVRGTIGQDWQPEQLRIRGVPSNRHESLQVFAQCRASRHHDSTGLAFPTEFLSRRLNLPPPANTSPPIRPWQHGPADADPIVEQLYRLVASRIPYRNVPTLDQVGSLLGVSPRTLKRHLAAAGMSYTRLLDRMRFDQACELLTSGDLTVSQIALELGYSGSNNFIRSFRRLTGTTPHAYRQQRQ